MVGRFAFVLTRKLCYCKDDRAMHLIYECLESFQNFSMFPWE